MLGLAFVKNGCVTSEKSMEMVVKAQCGLGRNGRAWWRKISETLYDLGFIRCHGNPEIRIWINQVQYSYDYDGTHTDDTLVIAKHPQGILDN